MRILAIRGRALNSLADDFEVCLDGGPLAQAGLFAITGPTGSGKSTLLDALCLALFDEMPRLQGVPHVLVGREGSGERRREAVNDVRSILHRGAADGFCEVDFRGADGRRYRARWEVRRARRRAEGGLQPQEMSLVDLDSGERFGSTKTEVLAEIAQRVGLTFDQFRRSVLLAQGDFAAFVRAKAGDRADVLERMTGTEIYGRVSKLAHERCAREKAKVETFVQQRAAVSIRLEEERDRDALEIERLEQEATRLADEETSGRKLDESAVRAEDLARAMAESERGVVESERRHGEAAGGVREAEAWLAEHAADEPLARAWDRWRADIDRFRDAGDELVGLVRRRDELVERAVAAAKERDECRAAVDEAQRAADGAQAAVDEAQRAAETLPRDELRRQRERLGRLEGFQRDLRLLREGVVAESRRHAELLAKVDAARAEAEAARASARDAERREAELSVRVDEAAQGHAAAAAARSLESRRRELVAGEPCPLCGSTAHPWAEGSPASAEAEVLAERLAALRRERERALAERTAAEERVLGRRREEDGGRVEAVACAAGLDGMRGRWSELRDKTLREAEIDVGEDPRIEEAERRCAEVGGALDAERAALEAREEKAVRIDREVVEARRKLDEERGRLDESREKAERAEQALRDVEEARRTTDAAMAIREETRRRALDDLAGAFPGRENWRGELEGDAAAFHTACAKRVEVWSGVRGKLETARAAQVEASGALQEGRRVLAARREELVAAKEELGRRTGSAGVAPTRDAVAALLAGLRARQAEGQRRLGALREVQRADEERRRQAEELDRGIEDARAGSRRWEELDQLIGSAEGKVFRVFAQGLTLDVLLAHANRQLGEIARRYRLERAPGQDLDLQVIDRDMGDEVRGLAGLSGGETFLVSLALALGLASMASTDLRIESLFIDEGFGSLDRETLEGALAALDALQATGRQVGIISHVEGLAEHIGARILVEKLGGGRSRVVVPAG